METELEKIARILGKQKSGFKMPFGKFENCDLADIPESYLNWYFDNGDNNNIKYEITKEFNRRKRK